MKRITTKEINVFKQALQLIQTQSNLAKAIKVNLHNLNNISIIKPHILVIEDNLIIQKFLKNTLQQLGCKVATASNGKQAITKFHSYYNLVLLDIGLPDIDGFCVANYIRNYDKPRNKNIPIVITTIVDQKSIQKKCKQAKIDDVRGKLINIVDVQNVLNKWIPKIHKQPINPIQTC